MNTTNYLQELRAVVSICEGKAGVRGILLYRLRDDHFGWEACEELWRRITTLLQNGKAIPSIRSFEGDPALSEDAKALLANELDSAELVTTKEDANALCDILDEYRLIRAVNSASHAAFKRIQEGETSEIKEVLAELKQKLFNAESGETGEDLLNLGVEGNSDELFEEIYTAEEPELIRLGFKEFDRRVGGIDLREVMVIGAPTGGGKSLLAQQISQNVVLNHGDTCIINFEMPPRSYYQRILSSLSGVPLETIRLCKMTPREKAQLAKSRMQFEKFLRRNNIRFTIWCPKSTDLTASQITSYLQQYRYQMVVVDYLGLMKSDDENNKNQQQVLGDLVRECKMFANNHNCAVIVLVQVDEETGKVKYSKAITHHAAIIWQWKYGDEERSSGKVQIIQSKCRNSEPFPFFLHFLPATMSAKDWDGKNDVVVAKPRDRDTVDLMVAHDRQRRSGDGAGGKSQRSGRRPAQ